MCKTEQKTSVTGNFSKLTWECIEQYIEAATAPGGTGERFYIYTIERAKIFGGWLVKSHLYAKNKMEGMGVGGIITSQDQFEICTNIAYVPDATHEWSVKVE